MGPLETATAITLPIVTTAIVFGTVAAIVIAAIRAGQAGKRELHDTARRAIEAGQPLSVDVIAALHKPPRVAGQDLRSGVTLSALAIGLLVAGVLSVAGVIEAGGDGGGFFLAALIVGAIGVGRLIAWFLRDRIA